MKKKYASYCIIPVNTSVIKCNNNKNEFGIPRGISPFGDGTICIHVNIPVQYTIRDDDSERRVSMPEPLLSKNSLNDLYELVPE